MANEQAPKVTVRIDNAASVRRQLREAAPDLLKEIDKANREAAKPILAIARAYVDTVPGPLYGWLHNGRTGWNANDVRKGMKFKAGRKVRGSEYRALLLFQQENTAGAIFEVTGRKSKGRNRPDFVTKLNNAYPRRSRLLWRAVDEQGIDIIQNEIIENYRSFEVKLNARLENTSGN